MPNRFSDQADILSVLIVHFGAVGITFLNIENGLKIASLIVAILYGLRKWYLMEVKAKE